MNIPYGRQTIGKADIEAVASVLNSEFLTTGPKVAEFEEKFALFVGAKYAVAVSNGTAALHLACLAAGLKNGDELITSPMTFAASANCALYCGAKPVFVDIKAENGLIDERLIEKKITPKTKIVIPVHYTGLPCDMKQIHAIAKKHNIIIIEDASHALGSRYKGTKIGDCKYSDMAIFSFHPVKHITTGEGGMITTNSKDFYEKLLRQRTHGITKDPDKLLNKNEGSWFYEMQEFGFNYRLTDFQCALGISQLNKVKSFIKKRVEIAKTYDKEFSKTDGVEIIKPPEGYKNAHHLYIIKVKDRKTRLNLFNYLKEQGLLCQVHYIPVYWHPYYQKLGFKKGICPKAEEFYEKIISIPMYPSLKNKEQKKVIKIINDFMYDRKIIGKRFYLRKLDLKDATQKYCSWLNDSAVNKYLETHQATIADIREYIKKQQTNPNSFFVGIFDKETNKHIGNMKLEPINWGKKNAMFGMLIGDKDYWGKGIGVEATRLLVDYAFNQMGLSEVVLGVVSENIPAIRVYKKVGFNVLKINKNAVQYGDNFFDQIIMSIKKNE